MYSDAEDDKSNVRSAIDAMCEGLKKNGEPKKRGRGRPRKYATASSSRPSGSTRSHKSDSRNDSESEEEEQHEDGDEETVEERAKRRKREEEDEEWDEEQEELTLSQRREMRTRKRPMLYSEESVMREMKNKQQNSAKRPRNSHGNNNGNVSYGRGRPLKTSSYAGPSRAVNVTYNMPAANLTPKEKQMLDRLRQAWRDIENPALAKQRILPLLRRGMFEKALDKIMPTFDSSNPTNPPKHDLMVNVMSVFDRLDCSAGFLEFLNNVSESALIAVYDVCDQLFLLSPTAPDNQKVAQALRFWWNSLSFSTRRKWESYARKLTHAAHCSYVGHGGSEVPMGRLSEQRQKDEEEWERLRATSINMGYLEMTEDAIVCPICDRDPELQQQKDPHQTTHRMKSMRDIQDHFFQHHWQAHGYACPFCGVMYSTADELAANHSSNDCKEFLAWNTQRILGQTGIGKMAMKCARMLLCCADCGWHMPLSAGNAHRDPYGRRHDEDTEKQTLQEFKAFLAHHNNDGLISMLIYFPEQPKVDSVRFSITPLYRGDIESPCNLCVPAVRFADPVEAREHVLQVHEGHSLPCNGCSSSAPTEYFLREHQMSHFDNAHLADYLTNTARIFPPPTNMSHAPRCGWKERAATKHYAFGGLDGGVGEHKGYDLVDPNEDMHTWKARLINKRRREGKPQDEPDVDDVEESDMARKVREKLMKKFGDAEGICGFNDLTWLTDESADMFKKWMEYWESPEGKRLGGPEEKAIDSGMTAYPVQVPSVVVELSFTQMHGINGFLLNDNVFYCTQCDTILKGDQAAEHLKQAEMEEQNKCALESSGFLQQCPYENSKMVQLFHASLHDADRQLECPHCDAAVCSIRGLRTHVLGAHGRYVRYQRAEGEKAVVPLRFDIRSRHARAVDEKLGMAPGGLLRQRFPMDTVPSALTWSTILPTRDNTDPALLAQMQALVEADRTGGGGAEMMHMQQRSGAGSYASRTQNYKLPVAMQSHPMSLEQSLMMRNNNGNAKQQQQQGRVYSPNSVSPAVARPVQQAARAARPVPYRPPVPAAPPGREIRKLVEPGSTPGSLVCRVCARNESHPADMVKGHLLRCHLNTCGHCTAIFAYDAEAKKHAAMCRRNRDNSVYHPDPRLPHIFAQCPFCPEQARMSELLLHMLNHHMLAIKYEFPNGKLTCTIKMVQHGRVGGKQPEVERLRFSYYMPSSEIAKANGYRQCHVCGLHLGDQQKLNMHLRGHSEFSYYCWLCPRPQSVEMGSVADIVKHIISGHLKGKDPSRGPVPCPKCSKDISSRALSHILYECDYNMMCQLCRDFPTFDSAAELKDHKEKCHYDTLRRFECNHCTAYFSNTNDYTKHACNEDHMQTRCDCGMICKTRALYDRHYAESHVRGQTCTLCNLKYTTAVTQRTDQFNHGKYMRHDVPRNMLMCAYGNQSAEQRALLTSISNASFRLRDLLKHNATGGTADEPLELSDDDDCIIEEVPPAASASPPAAPVPEDDDEIVKQAVKKLVQATVETDARRVKLENGEKEEEVEEEGERVEQPSPAASAAPAAEIAQVLDDDDDVMLVDDDGVTAPQPPSAAAAEAAAARTLSAHVRVEAEDANAIGGKDQPGYADEDEEEQQQEGDGAAVHAQPVMREFTPEGDDDLCVVAEVENPGCVTAAATIAKQREKKFGCTKCSSRFITQATLADHLRTAHRFDAGDTTIMEELGIPRKQMLWMCKSCSIAFPNEPRRRNHCDAHGPKQYACDTCSMSAYNQEVMRSHHNRILDGKISFICGECKIEYDNDTSLHEHSQNHHGVQLFYFCKHCEMGSTDGIEMMDHYMRVCTAGYMKRQKSMGIAAKDDAWKYIGVIPACQLHYQPNSLDAYKEQQAKNPAGYVTPSVCNHRSLVVAVERQVSCNTCKCLETIQRHDAMVQIETGKEFNQKQIRRAVYVKPLAALRAQYESLMNRRREEAMRDERRQRPSQGVPRAYDGLGRTGNVTVTPGNYNANEAQRIHNDRIQMLQQARGGGQRMPAMLAHGGGHMINGGGGSNMMRGSPSYSGGYSQQQQPLQQLQQQPYRLPVAASSASPPVFPQYHHVPANRQGPPRSSYAPGAPSTMSSVQALAAAAIGAHGAHGAGAHSATNGAGVSAEPAFSKKCSDCMKVLTSARESFLHQHHISDWQFVCAKCPCGFKGEKDAVKHIMNHMPTADRELEMDMDCPFDGCSKSHQPTLLALKAHIPAHNPPLEHRCQNCFLTFGSQALARAHDDQHKISGSRNCCVLCGSMDNWEAEMTDNDGKMSSIRHILLHAFQHRYRCKICMEQFEQEDQIVTHYIFNHSQEEAAGRSCTFCQGVNLDMRTETDYKVHCIDKHTLTELFVPRKVEVKIPLEFCDYLGVPPEQRAERQWGQFNNAH